MDALPVLNAILGQMHIYAKIVLMNLVKIFFLLLLTLLKDNAQNYESLRTKCMKISNVLDSQLIIDTAQMFFDPRVHKIDNHAQSILETTTNVITSNTKAVEVIGDGDCGFHSFQVFYPSIDENEIRTRVIVELCAHEQYYNSLACQHGFDLVDDESVQDRVLRIVNKGEYTGILALSALASVFGCVVDSTYPNINGKDEYIDVLNTSFRPRSTQSINSDVSEAFHIRILWSSPEAYPGHDWHPNHFVPLLYAKFDADNSMEEQNTSILTTAEAVSPLEVHHNLLQFKNQGERMEIDSVKSNITCSSSDASITFLQTTDIIERIMYSSKSKILDVPPKMMSKSSVYIIENSEEKRRSIRKDGLGVWIQDRSIEVPLVLSNRGLYQLVRQNTQGNWYYNKRIGNKYVPQVVDENNIVFLKR